MCNICFLQELGPVFEIPRFQEFPVSYTFEAVVGLPSNKVLPSPMQYLPSWQVGLNIKKLAISELSFASVSKRVYMQNHSYENVFHLHVHFHANQTPFHLDGFARRLILKLRQRVTWKWSLFHL